MAIYSYIIYIDLLIIAFASSIYYYVASELSSEQQDLVDTSLNRFKKLPLPDAYSPIYLIETAEHEAQVYKALLEIRETHSHLISAELLRKIEVYLFNYEEEQARLNVNYTFAAGQRARRIAQNPLLTLTMVWRFSRDLTQIYNELKAEPTISSGTVAGGLAGAFFNDDKAFANWPDAAVLHDVLLGVLRIQMVYGLDATDLASGRIFGSDSGARLSLPLVYSLGKFPRIYSMYNLAIPWLELTRYKLSSIDEPSQQLALYKFNIAEVEHRLMETMMEHDLEWSDLELESDENHQFYYGKKLLDAEQRPVKERFPIRQMNLTHFQRSGLSDHNTMNSWSLCSGDNHQTDKEKSKLFCWYETTSNSALTIYPIKMEMLSKTPYIVQMYDVLSETYTKKFGLTDPKLQEYKRSMTANGEKADENGVHRGFVSNIRTSLEVVGNHDFPKLSKLIEIVTGLRVIPSSSSEEFRVAHYSPTGHYDCHLDAPKLEVINDGKGTRIATMMFYLDNTTAGGFTAFPQAGIAARPVEGSGLFWYNLTPDGEIDETTYHCACPVITGTKTIVTKWIRHNDQFQSRPCGLQKNSKICRLLPEEN